MFNNDDIFVLRQSIDKFGEQLQFILTQEECGELIAKLSHYMRFGPTEDCIADVIDGIADAQIMLDTLKLIFGADAVDKVRIQKIRRLKNRIEKVAYND